MMDQQLEMAISAIRNAIALGVEIPGEFATVRSRSKPS